MMVPSRRTRIVAAPALGERGGGVGQVARLLWETVSETWPGEAEIMTLLTNGHALPTPADKLRFGGALASRQMLGRAGWIVFAHLGIAKIERAVPASLRVPYAVFLHGIECWHRLPERDRRTLAEARVRIANSEFTARRTAASNPDVGSIVVCPLALGREAETAPSPPVPSPGRKTVLIVGRMSSAERYKGHQELITCWPGVVAAVPDARLVIVGDGDDRPRLERLARCGPAANSIEFAGFVPREQLDAVYAQASVFAMPSRGEGFGLVYLEAMWHGVPCVGSTEDAASEIIEDGRTGVLVDSEDDASLGRALIGLLTDDGWRRRLGESARASARERFTFDRFRRQVSGVLQDALEDADARGVVER